MIWVYLGLIFSGGFMFGFIAGGMRMHKVTFPTIVAYDEARSEVKALRARVDELTAENGQLQRRVMEETARKKREGKK